MLQLCLCSQRPCEMLRTCSASAINAVVGEVRESIQWVSGDYVTLPNKCLECQQVGSNVQCAVCGSGMA